MCFRISFISLSLFLCLCVQSGFSAALYAASTGNMEVLQWLVEEKGVDVNCENKVIDRAHSCMSICVRETIAFWICAACMSYRPSFLVIVALSFTQYTRSLT